jgi:hypothetical protein
MRGGIQLLQLVSDKTKQCSAVETTNSPAPDGELFVDGALVGTTPAMLRLAPGKHTITVSSGSVNDYPKEFTITSAIGLKLEATLDSIRFGLNDSRSNEGGQRAKWPHKRLSERHVGPFAAELYCGISDLGEQVLVRDFNEHGLYFWSCRRIAVGGNVEIRLEPPVEVSPNGGRRMRYRATVLRVEEAPEGRFGTAALIKRCNPG